MGVNVKVMDEGSEAIMSMTRACVARNLDAEKCSEIIGKVVDATTGYKNGDRMFALTSVLASEMLIVPKDMRDTMLAVVVEGLVEMVKEAEKSGVDLSAKAQDDTTVGQA